MPGIPNNGGSKLQHRVVELDSGDGVTPILEANPARLRCLIYNATAPGTNTAPVIGDRVDVDGDALAVANGWLLKEGVVAGLNKTAEYPNVVELFTKDTVYGFTAVDNTMIRILEELLA